MSHEFDEATTVESVGDGRYRTAIRDGWDIGGNANGGYLMALAANAMRRECERAHPVSMTMHYLAPASSGEVECETRVLKAGRRFATVSATLVRDGRPLVAALGTFGTLADDPTMIHSSLQPPDLPPFEECQQRGAVADVPALTHKLEMRLHPDDTGFARGAPTGRAEMRAWFGFADGRPIDPMAVLLAVDSFPPVLFNVVGAIGWMPTLELTVHLRCLPAAGRLRCRFESRLAQGGLWEESGEIWDADGRCVALSRQLALVPQSDGAARPAPVA